MTRIVRGALLQTDWTGDKESMIQKHEAAAQDAQRQGVQVLCLQEIFYGPYFCPARTTAGTTRAERSPTARPPGSCRNSPGSTGWS